MPWISFIILIIYDYPTSQNIYRDKKSLTILLYTYIYIPTCVTNAVEYQYLNF